MSTPLADADVSQNFQLDPKDKVVLILCGLIASGKSTFAEALQQHFPQFRRCNQDDLGDRRSVERLARQSLSEGYSVCIDRTNFNATQRSYWIEIAREFPGTVIWVIVFDTPHETCAARLQHRTSHPTIKSPQQGLAVLSQFAANFQHPAPEEGYDRILYVKPSDHLSPVYSSSDVGVFLQRVCDSPPVQSGVQGPGNTAYPSGSNRSRGYGYRGSRRGNSHHVPRGGGGSNSRPAVNNPRGWHTSWRGHNVGLQSAGRGLWRNSSGVGNQTQQTGNSAPGTGTSQDPYLVD